MSTQLFEKGSTDFLTVLDAQRNLYAAQDATARSEQQVAADLIALYKALGGGWD
jgi:multidrug efflux system outer membrane protein